jgi:GNAT superfamily N-acetyltransferase
MAESLRQEPGEPPPITLRPLGPADSAGLQQVYEGANDIFVASTGAPVRPDQADQDLADTLGDDARYLLGVFWRDRMVGVVDFRLAEPEPLAVRLGLILLSQPYRRQGLGSWALRILEEWLRQATPTLAIMVTVRAQDFAAQAFFRHHGYVYTGQAVRLNAGPAGSSRLLWLRKDL